MDGKFVAYYRVSTRGQGVQGLGMEAQRQAVENYLNGGDWVLLDSFEEVESGKRADRPEMAKAIELCRKTGATLVIAKLDRLARDVHFLTGLQKAGIDFVACDMPQADRFTIHIFAALAEKEREMISARTKAGLDVIRSKIAKGETYVSKRSGQPVTKLGGRGSMTAEKAALGRQKRSQKASEKASRVAPTMKALRDAGMTLAQIAERMNEMGQPTSRGAQWTPMAVKRVLDRPQGV